MTANPLRTAEDYELFIYTMKNAFPSIRHSTLTFVRRGASLARVAGELHFDYGFRLVVRERLVYDHLPATIDWYGYEIWRGSERLCWYDSQPHPGDAHLKSTDPHHKHEPPDIKYNRVPAPRMSFTRPNLFGLIREIEELIEIRQTANRANGEGSYPGQICTHGSSTNLEQVYPYTQLGVRQ